LFDERSTPLLKYTVICVFLRRPITGSVTRGKRLVVLCGSRRALDIAIANQRADQRRTLLTTKLADNRPPG